MRIVVIGFPTHYGHPTTSQRRQYEDTPVPDCEVYLDTPSPRELVRNAHDSTEPQRAHRRWSPLQLRDRERWRATRLLVDPLPRPTFRGRGIRIGAANPMASLLEASTIDLSLTQARSRARDRYVRVAIRGLLVDVWSRPIYATG